MKLEEKIKKENKVINKVAGRGKEIKIHKSRVAVYEKGKYKGWVKKSDFLSLKRQKSFSLKPSKRKGFFKTKLNPVYFQKTVTIKTGKMKKAERRIIKIATYTKTQRKLVAKMFKERKIPIRKPTTLQKLIKVDLRKAFTSLGFKASKLIAPS